MKNTRHILRNTLISTCFALGALSTIAMPLSAQAAGQTSVSATAQTAGVSAAETRTGMFYVQKRGVQNTQKPALILIPGLSCDADSWRNVLTAFEKDYAIYLVTFAGFGGRPVPEKLAAQPRQDFEASLLQLIRDEKLNKPVLIGHSIGASLSQWFATQHSDQIRGVVAVDGLPVFPFSENAAGAQRAAMAAQMKQGMSSLQADAFAASQKNYMRTVGMIDPSNADFIAERAGKSDPATVASWMSDVYLNDFRADLPKISVPVLLISPYYAPDMQNSRFRDEAVKHAYWAELSKGIPQLTIKPVSGSRHFPMEDQPAVLNQAIRDFVTPLAK